MSFLDKAKEKASHLANQVKDKVEDVQDRRKADDLLDDLGRIIYRQRTQESMADDDARIDELVAQLKALADAGTAILDDKADRSKDAAPSSPMPPPPPPAG